MKKPNLPKYVSLILKDGSKGTAMRLQKDIDRNEWEYWRNAGYWGISFRIENGKLLSDAKYYGEDFQYLDGRELIEITEAEWREDNRGYV